MARGAVPAPSAPPKNAPRHTAECVIQALRETKGMVTLAAKRLRCHPSTIRRCAERHATVAEALREEREGVTDVAEMALYDAIRAGEGWAVCFYLKTQGKSRGYVERQEVTGRDGQELLFHVVYGDAGEANGAPVAGNAGDGGS